MNIKLFFPPGWGSVVQNPYLALPTLTGYLRSRQIEVAQRDLNIEIIHYLFSPQYCQLLQVKMEQKYSQLNKLPRRFAKEQTKQLIIAKKLLEITPQRLRDAMNRFRNSDIKDAVLNYSKRVALFKQLSFILSAIYYPNKIDLQHLSVIGFYLPDFLLLQGMPAFTLSNFYRHTLNEKNNFFFDIYSSFFKSEFKPQEKDLLIAGISLSRKSQLSAALTLAHFIKARRKNVCVVLGGAMITYLEEAIANFPKIFDLIDCFVVGEGEIPLLRIIETLNKKDKLDSLPGTIIRRNGKVIKHDKRIELSPEEFPAPDFSDYNLWQYFSPLPVVLPYLTARGCYWNKCAFCSLSSSYGSYREISMSKMAQELRQIISRYGCQNFYFVDECISPRRTRVISEMLRKEKLKIFWVMEARLEKSFSPEIFQEAYNQGCRMISWGIESASDRVLKLMHKGTAVSNMPRILKASHEAGIWNNSYIMFAFPGETLKEMNMTTDFIIKSKSYLDTVNAGTFYLQKYSPVYEQSAQFNIVIDKVPADYCNDFYSFNHRRYLPSGKSILCKRRQIVARRVQRIKRYLWQHVPLWEYGEYAFILVTTESKLQVRNFLKDVKEMGIQWE